MHGAQTGRPEHFYPRSPCGERLLTEINKMATGQISIHALLAESDAFLSGSIKFCKVFLSTLSLRRATEMGVPIPALPHDFYPRSPCGERLIFAARHMTVRIFLSTLSLRRATSALYASCPRAHFYPRSPCGERPPWTRPPKTGTCISIHALLAESDTAICLAPPTPKNFYPRSPCGERHSGGP